MPPKEKVTMVRAAITPAKPIGRKPPWDHRLCRPAVVPSSAWAPRNMRMTPPKIMATMASTLMRESQNSTSPKLPTWMRLIRPITTMVAATHAQAGTAGNHSSMYLVMAKVSATITTASSNTKVQPVR